MGIRLNAVALAMFGFIKILEAGALVGKSIVISKFSNGDLAELLPVNGKILHRITLGDEKDWLLVGLEKPVKYNEIPVSKVLVKRKDGEALKLKRRHQICFLRFVVNDTDLNCTSDKARFPFTDWVLCE